MADPRETIRKAVREGGPELDMMMALLESAVRLNTGFLGGLRIAMKNTGGGESPLAPFLEALEAWALEAEADAFAESPEGLKDLVAVSPFPANHPMSLPMIGGTFHGRQFLRLPSGEFLNLDQAVTVAKSGFDGSMTVIAAGGTAIQLRGEDSRALRQLLEDAAYHLQPLKVQPDLGGAR